jgi:hypothetical protein
MCQETRVAVRHQQSRASYLATALMTLRPSAARGKHKLSDHTQVWARHRVIQPLPPGIRSGAACHSMAKICPAKVRPGCPRAASVPVRAVHSAALPGLVRRHPAPDPTALAGTSASRRGFAVPLALAPQPDNGLVVQMLPGVVLDAGTAPLTSTCLAPPSRHEGA